MEGEEEEEEEDVDEEERHLQRGELIATKCGHFSFSVTFSCC